MTICLVPALTYLVFDMDEELGTYLMTIHYLKERFLIPYQDNFRNFFLIYIYKAIRYPKSDRESRFQGVVLIDFIIDENGFVKNPVVKKDVAGSGLGEEVLHLIKEMPQWIPARDKGKAVAVERTLPVKFIMEDLDEKSYYKSVDLPKGIINAMPTVIVTGRSSDMTQKKGKK